VTTGTVKTCTVLVIARQSRLRDGLQAVLRAAPWVDDVVCAEGQTAVTLLGFPEMPMPALTILDIEALRDATLREWPGWCTRAGQTQLIVLVGTAQQRPQADALGAEAILLKGFSTETLYQTMERLLKAGSHTPRPSTAVDGR